MTPERDWGNAHARNASTASTRFSGPQATFHFSASTHARSQSSSVRSTWTRSNGRSSNPVPPRAIFTDQPGLSSVPMSTPFCVPSRHRSGRRTTDCNCASAWLFTVRQATGPSAGRASPHLTPWCSRVLDRDHARVRRVPTYRDPRSSPAAANAATTTTARCYPNVGTSVA
jgi:hypothetical protein